MRRKWLVAGSIMAVVLAAVFVCLLAPSSKLTFAFLEGRARLTPANGRYYVFQAQAGPLLAAAKEEFLERGYTLTINHDDGSSIKAHHDRYGVIDIYTDTKWSCNPSGDLCWGGWGPEPGWISVVFWEDPDVTPWDRVLDTFGF